MSNIKAQMINGDIDDWQADGYAWTNGFLTIWRQPAKPAGPYSAKEPQQPDIIATYAPGQWVKAWIDEVGK